MTNADASLEPIILSEQRGGVRIITLNRPHARNALTTALIDTVRGELAAADVDD